MTILPKYNGPISCQILGVKLGDKDAGKLRGVGRRKRGQPGFAAIPSEP